jgi:hypothetical protein
MIATMFTPTLGLVVLGLMQAGDPPKPADTPQQAKPAVQTPTPDAAKPDPSPARQVDAELLKSLEKQLKPDEEENALDRVGRRMRDVQGRLVKSDPGDETRTIQKEIVEDLDKLIEAMKKGGG